jgi:hypothetical protein
VDKVEIILYGAASYLAIRSLVSLMADHRQEYKKKVAAELAAAQREVAQRETAAPPNPKPANPTKKAG